MKIFRTDNDTEYFDIIKVCIENDIQHQKIDVYTHEQAVDKKRINLTLLNKIRVMLFLIKLNKRFWIEALLTTVCLYNKTLHTSINYKFSYELKFDHKSNLKLLKKLCNKMNKIRMKVIYSVLCKKTV